MKVNEIKTKKGADLLQHLIDYYQAQHKYVLYINHNYKNCVCLKLTGPILHYQMSLIIPVRYQQI